MRVHVAAAGPGLWQDHQVAYVQSLAAHSTRQQHQLTDDPESADAILFVDLHQHPDDSRLDVLRHNELLRRWPGKCFVYDERDNPFFTLPGLYVGATPRLVSRQPVVSSPYLYVPPLAEVALPQPVLLFSFRGARTSPVRADILALEDDRGSVVDTSDVDFFDSDSSSQEMRSAAAVAYAELIGRSKFVLCPRGHGPSSFRLFETLRAGRVPVIISDEWVPPPGIPWGRCSLRVAERDVAGIPELLASLEPTWPELAAGAVAVHSETLAPATLWDYVIGQLASINHRGRGHRTDWRYRLLAERLVNRVKRASPVVAGLSGDPR